MIFTTALLLPACAADYRGNVPDAPSVTTNPLELERQIAASANSAHVNFHFADFYSLMAPQPSTGCAGDAKSYGQPFVLDSATGYKAFPESTLDPTTTIKPDFIKNVSVDLTDANSELTSNRARGCSFGTGLGLPSPTSCATFDYGAAGGVASSLGGSLLLIGGIQDTSYTPRTASCGVADGAALYTNACGRSALALALETLPASAATDPPSELAPGIVEASGPISSWVNLGASISYTGPQGLAGAGAAFDTVGKKLLLFGGSEAHSLSNSTLLGRTSSGSWLMDLDTQSWKEIPALGNTQVDPKILKFLDTGGGTSHQLQKATEARMNFGYVAVPAMAFDSMSKTDAVSVDRTDRIVIVGGVGAAGALKDIRRFNPTYGPDWVDRYQTLGPPTISQWLDSYHTQLMSNATTLSSHLEPDFPPNSPATPNLAVQFGTVALRDSTGDDKGGYVGVVGGFDSTLTTNAPSGTCDSLGKCGVLSIAEKSSGDKTGFLSLPNDLSGAATQPAIWDLIDEDTNTVPWYGGATLLPGFSIKDNDVVYFGGTSCRSYLTVNTPGCSFANPGFYWQLKTQPQNLAKTLDANVKTFAYAAQSTTMTSPPNYAGMAAARGVTPDDKVVIVAWGGAQAAKTSAPADKVYVLYDDTASGKPTWFWVSTSGGPTGVANGALVFSHVTKKFYLFGGYSPTMNYLSGDTWELSITSSSCTPATCTFAWKQLNTDPLFTCYPNCPSARHSHQMVEANYYNRDPSGAIAASGESTCTDQYKPCSYGIFMEGGNQSGGGTELAADRWMFDPTANGAGQWLRMGELPPRTLSAMTALEYKLPDGNTTVRRALLFGGETGMQSPLNATPGKYLVAPTLGDTLLFDFENERWNRVELLGKGYAGALPASPVLDNRTGYDASNPVSGNTNDLSVLSPPPLAGAVMVTRTHKIGSKGTPEKLLMPEAYLFGGRQKDGSPLPLSKIYKFCTGTTGENSVTNSADCNYFDSSTNPDLLVPTDKAEGRWILKQPTLAQYSFMGAAAYDSSRDKIALVGGIHYTAVGANPVSVTQTTNLSASSSVFEYTPATKYSSATTSEINGSWAEVKVCDESETPTARYGHSLTFDPTKRRLILVGGYAIDGTPLTHSVTDWNGTYNAPDIWVGKRIDVAVSDGEIPGIPEISGTVPCYYWSRIEIFGNTRSGDPTQAPPEYGLAHASSLYLPSAGYNTGYYTLLDNACEYQGPIASTEPAINKLLAGGAYIDIDRSKLGPHENLLLNLTYLPLGTDNLRPDSQAFSTQETAAFKIHLVKTGQSAESLMRIFQPRYFTFTASEQYPEIAHTISVLAPPAGQVRQEQILIPLMLDPAIDRIRIERYSGSGILIDMSLFRMGYR